MPDTRILSSDAPALLREDHARMRDLFAAYRLLGEGPRPSKRELFELLRRELAVHALIEEDIFFPAIEHAPDRTAPRLVAEARQEHRILKTLLSEIGAMGPDDEGFDARMTVLQETVGHHADKEERKLFRIFALLPSEIREDLSDRLRTRRAEMDSIIDPE